MASAFGRKFVNFLYMVIEFVVLRIASHLTELNTLALYVMHLTGGHAWHQSIGKHSCRGMEARLV